MLVSEIAGICRRQSVVALWQKAFKICCNAGLSLLNIHAGEHCLQCAAPEGGEPNPQLQKTYDGPGNVRAALAVGSSRIGHGIEAIKDSALVDELALRSTSVCLEICLLSNRCLGYCPQGLAQHPILELLSRGVACCLCSDDPSYFGSPNGHGLVREFLVARHILHLDDTTLADLARNSIRHSRAPHAVKMRALKGVTAWLALPSDSKGGLPKPLIPPSDTVAAATALHALPSFWEQLALSLNISVQRKVSVQWLAR